MFVMWQLQPMLSLKHGTMFKCLVSVSPTSEVFRLIQVHCELFNNDIVYQGEPYPPPLIRRRFATASIVHRASAMIERFWWTIHGE